MKVTKNLTLKIVIALILGIVVGSIFNMYAGSGFVQNTNQYVFNVLGQIFLNLIFMLVVPVVFVSIVLGVVGVGDPKLLGGIGLKTVIFFLTTTALAIIIAMALALVFKPGDGHSDLLNSQEVKKYGEEQKAKSGDTAAPENQTFDQTLINLFPKNPMQSMVEQDMLPIITFAIFIGIGMIALGTKVEGVRKVFEQTNDILMYIVTMIMNYFAPIGTFGLVATAFTNAGFGAIKQLGMYFFVVLLALAVHFFIVYGGAVKILGGKNPLWFFKKFFPAMTVGFSSSSSNATLPISLECTKDMGVRKEISSFVQPLGATINMDGTAIMQGVATIFIAQVSGIDLTVMQMITVVLIAVIASIGTAGVPGVGLVMLAMILTSIGINPAAIGMIIGIDRLLDMTRTAVNITGDAACALILSEREKSKLAK
ncbi:MULTISPECIES: dicarboxylate/amino acid:cation symporter [Mammaliicoccus]|uniref:Dicarboxylate/amino acid:cation symporter n=1 Tax=Mammaliicoccus fleurettii TaxID=150056 RepID=A0ABS5MMJ4_9STAP|nr:MULTISPECIES: dicarboxylate/amino acid:cation symporter [Mammaliicoccus]HCN60205.1 dicarboxylate/amino acid:cation symporter [Staphylococcus sp.]MBL0847175.1 dicarboxylate/amino acid:cation symporter [Mammaliicoccus fleurettii]MBO3062145.1 dicarboxylate/amino acid:cation symporter [Mammaliicoccus fleurettii]MBS3671830.1 dicarboxylate/amino acid:cation symporter [Mammaliicoccus fleurettii]MBS3696857.1 dicarboxylate/amino acid:cation symporter [Mammaliicoccus fleurettii]